MVCGGRTNGKNVTPGRIYDVTREPVFPQDRENNATKIPTEFTDNNTLPLPLFPSIIR